MKPISDPCLQRVELPLSESSNELDIHVELSFRDTLLVAFQVFFRRARAGIVLYCVIVAASVVSLVLMGSGGFPGMAFVIFLALLFPATVAALVCQNAKSGFEQASCAVHVMQYHLSSEGVLIETLERPGWFEWDTFASFLELKMYFVLFVDDYHYYVIPKRSLRELGQTNKLRAVLDRHVKVLVRT